MQMNVELGTSPGFGKACDLTLKDGTILRNAIWTPDKTGGHFTDADGNTVPNREIVTWSNDRQI